VQFIMDIIKCRCHLCYMLEVLWLHGEGRMLICLTCYQLYVQHSACPAVISMHWLFRLHIMTFVL